MRILLAITPCPAISALFRLVLAVAVLDLARHTAHQAIHTTAVALSRGHWRMINDLERLDGLL
jgi:hypothetical protein